MTDPRTQGRLKPRQVLVGTTPPDPFGGGEQPIYQDDPRDVGVARKPLNRAEIERAFANPVRPESACCGKYLSRRPPPPPRTIVYVNGIMTGYKAHCCSLRKVASTTCANVVGVYNATEGPVPDLLQSKGDLGVAADAAAGRRTAVGDRRNPAVDSMRDLLVERGRAGQPTEVWAHSQGGAITSAALFDAKTKLEFLGVARPLENLTVNSFGSAAYQWPDGPRYTHYIHTGDPVATGITWWPARGGLGRGPFSEQRAGRGATIVVASGSSPEQDRLRGTYAWRDVEFPPPAQAQLWPQVDNDFRGGFAHHYMDSSYLPLYRQRAANNRGVGCTPDPLPAGDPCA